MIVISASGMMEAGRILHHAQNQLGDTRNCILFVGYQAAHTLGRRILEGKKEVRVFHEMMHVRAEVEKMNEFSAHADRNELMEWVRGFRTAPRRAFVVHGEEDQSRPFAERLRRDAGIPQVDVPGLGDEGSI
jgi:metallo-beta-lactamase family protein